ncbi:MAG: SLC13 family permease, partial [Verrucomicrobiae bacterium]|nr:SLC13 family permease [Verrucomicrobiae bacterium]
MEITLVFMILGLATLYFVTETYPPHVVAMLVLALLVVTSLVTPQEAFQGFSHEATITVACMFVLSAGLERTGAVRFLGKGLIRLGSNRFILLALLMVVAGGISAFINNTAAVAVFLPLVLTAARARKIPASRLLIPLSYASQFGGTCTLIGTSTNLLVSGIARDHGYAPFSMFEMTGMGLLLFGTGTLYFLIIGQWLLPGQRGPELIDTYALRDYLSELLVQPGSPLIGRATTELALTKTYDVTLVEIFRERRKIWFPLYEPIREGDVLLMRGKLDRLMGFQSRFKLAPWAEFKLTRDELVGGDRKMVEGLVAPGSEFIDQTLQESQLRQRFNTVVLGIQRHGQLLREKLAGVRLQLGDAVLLLGRPDDLERLQATGDFVLLGEVEREDPARRSRALRAMLIVGVALGAAAFHLTTITVAAMLGSLLLVLTRCLDAQDAHESIDWPVIFLMAGVLPLGVALDKSGAAAEIAAFAMKTVGTLGPQGVLAALYLVTAILTAVM